MGLQYKQTFTAGEITPLLYDRTDKDWREKACKALKNFILLPQGPVIRRPGTQFIFDITNAFFAHYDIRCIPFVFSETEAYNLIFISHPEGIENTRVLFGYEDGLVADPITPTEPLIKDLGIHMPVAGIAYAQVYDYMVIAHPDLAPYKFIRNSHTTWTLELAVFTDLTFADATEYPTVVTFHDQRLAFAGSAKRPSTIFMSKAGDLFNFSTKSPAADDDRVIFTLASGRQNKILWMQSADGLLVGTVGDEWRVTGGQDSFITPSSILAKKQTSKGSAGLRPLFVANTSIFLQRHKKVVNSFAYNLSSNGFQSSDLSILAEHLTRKNLINDWTYQQAPYSIIWCALSSGDLIGLTFESEHKIIAWHRHDTDGNVIAITAIPNDTAKTDRLWLIVEREINGEIRQFIELMDVLKVPDSIDDTVFLDSYLSYQGAPKQIISGLSHLAGKTVSILADGAVHPDKVVGANGKVTLDYRITSASIGLAYDSLCEPLFGEVSGATTGSTAKIARITKVLISIYKSLLFEYGTSDDDMELEPFRKESDLTGVIEPLFTGFREIVWQGDYSLSPTVLIKQSAPLPCTILSITNKVEVYG
jgi:hypothetical protein